MTFITRVPRVDTAFSNIFYDPTTKRATKERMKEERRRTGEKRKKKKERRDSALFSLINRKEIFHRLIARGENILRVFVAVVPSKKCRRMSTDDATRIFGVAFQQCPTNVRAF